jgi:dihydrofolate synthase/folylpolyglutamate synthase
MAQRFTSLAEWLIWQEQSHPRPIDLGLERVAGVHRKLKLSRKPLTITVGGTNGKGSCVAFLEAIYRAQGYTVGAYTSPHIVRYNERIRIDGQAVEDEAICRAFESIDAVRGDTSLSYFEFGTLAALKLFAERGVEIQLLEVGLGGRLDAVNIIEPDVALVTTIALDHMEWLGNNVDDIAREKAGIFRAGVPAIIGDDQISPMLAAVATEKKAQVLSLGQQFGYRKQGGEWEWFAGDLCFKDLPQPAFKGEHQYRNASAVIMAVSSLSDRFPVAKKALDQGLREAHLKGRFQFIDGDIPVLLDVGHNPQAVATLRCHLQSDFPNVKIHALFAMMKDKDIASVIASMRECIADWYLVPLNNPRAASPEQLSEFFLQQDIDNVHSDYANFKAAFDDVRQQAMPGDMILIFGSFFLVSEYCSQIA